MPENGVQGIGSASHDGAGGAKTAPDGGADPLPQNAGSHPRGISHQEATALLSDRARAAQAISVTSGAKVVSAHQTKIRQLPFKMLPMFAQASVAILSVAYDGPEAYVQPPVTFRHEPGVAGKSIRAKP